MGSSSVNDDKSPVVWGSVKRSRIFHIVAGLLAFLPLADIVTDYLFIIIALFGNSFEITMAAVGLAFIWNSSRVVVYFYVMQKEIIFWNAMIAIIPGSLWPISIFCDDANYWLIFGRCLLFIFCPLVYVFITIRICSKQCYYHFYHLQDYASFTGFAFLEIFE